MAAALERAVADGGTVTGGGRALAEDYPEACYAKPAIVEMPSQTEVVREETFAPILYVMTYSELTDAIAMHNDVPQGLSSCIFTNDVRESERFISAVGSDCGIANVNIGPRSPATRRALGIDGERRRMVRRRSLGCPSIAPGGISVPAPCHPGA